MANRNNRNNRADNADQQQGAVQNTTENLQEAEQFLAEHADEIAGEELSNIKNKNENRRQSIQDLRNNGQAPNQGE